MDRKDIYAKAREIVDNEAPDWEDVRGILSRILTGNDEYVVSQIDDPTIVRPRMAALADLLFLHDPDEDEGRTEVGSRNEHWLTGIVLCAAEIGAEMAFAQVLAFDGTEEAEERVAEAVRALSAKGLVGTGGQFEGT